MWKVSRYIFLLNRIPLIILYKIGKVYHKKNHSLLQLVAKAVINLFNTIICSYLESNLVRHKKLNMICIHSEIFSLTTLIEYVECSYFHHHHHMCLYVSFVTWLQWTPPCLLQRIILWRQRRRKERYVHRRF